MKLHIGVDDESRRVLHSMAAISAKVHDLTPVDQLRHGEEVRVWGECRLSGD